MTDEQEAVLDATIDAYRSIIATTQAAYHAGHNVYAQGLETHTTPPTVGTTAIPDRLAYSPSDQDEAWADLIPTVLIPDAWRFSVRVDVYSAGATAGYILIVSVLDTDGALYRRAIDEGPEGRSHDWRAVE